MVRRVVCLSVTLDASGVSCSYILYYCIMFSVALHIYHIYVVYDFGDFAAVVAWLFHVHISCVPS